MINHREDRGPATQGKADSRKGRQFEAGMDQKALVVTEWQGSQETYEMDFSLGPLNTHCMTFVNYSGRKRVQGIHQSTSLSVFVYPACGDRSQDSRSHTSFISSPSSNSTPQAGRIQIILAFHLLNLTRVTIPDGLQKGILNSSFIHLFIHAFNKH